MAAQPEAPVSDIIQVLKETALHPGCRPAPDALGSIRVEVTPEGIYRLAHLEEATRPTNPWFATAGPHGWRPRPRT